MDDPKAVEAWRDALQRSAHARGERIGEERGEARGREVGHHEGILEERTRAILDVLARRGITVSDQQAARILNCRDEAALSDLLDRAWSVGSADALD
ncbi:MAG TPA: hypothetical protein VIV60_04165 [Polyangiaceae bacterium]